MISLGSKIYQDFIINYIDWNAVWRDLNISDGYEYVNGYVFSMN